MSATPTGIPIIDCHKCGIEHPEQRKHCAACGAPSRFISDQGTCLRCDTPTGAPTLCEPCQLTDCRSCEGRTLLLDCDCAHLPLERS